MSYWLPESGDRPESVHFICYVTEDATFSKTKKEESSYGYAQNVSAETVRSHFKGWEKDLCDLLEVCMGNCVTHISCLINGFSLWAKGQENGQFMLLIHWLCRSLKDPLCSETQ